MPPGLHHCKNRPSTYFEQAHQSDIKIYIGRFPVVCYEPSHIKQMSKDLSMNMRQSPFVNSSSSSHRRQELVLDTSILDLTMSRNDASSLRLPPITNVRSRLLPRHNIVLDTSVLDPFRPARIPITDWAAPRQWTVNSNPPTLLTQQPSPSARGDGSGMAISTIIAPSRQARLVEATPTSHPNFNSQGETQINHGAPTPPRILSSPPSMSRTSSESLPPSPSATQALAMAHLRSMTPERAESIRRAATSLRKSSPAPQPRRVSTAKVAKANSSARELRPRNRRGRAVTTATSPYPRTNTGQMGGKTVGEGTEESPVVLD